MARWAIRSIRRWPAGTPASVHNASSTARTKSIAGRPAATSSRHTNNTAPLRAPAGATSCNENGTSGGLSPLVQELEAVGEVLGRARLCKPEEHSYPFSETQSLIHDNDS